MSHLSDTSDLLFHLPVGETAIVREPDGRWGVAIFETGTTHRLMTVASGMDKSIATWLSIELRDAVKRVPA